MKNKLFAFLTLALLSTLSPQLSTWAQGTAFTYQGRLNDGASSANGTYDVRFIVFDNSAGGSQQGATLTNSPTAVSNGLFTVTLDFGNLFPGANRWLEISVRTNGGGAFTTLSPRQKLTATPYAVTAGNVTGPLAAAQLTGTVPSAQLGGTYSGAVTFDNAGSSFTGNGSGLTSLNASRLTAGTVPNARLPAIVARTNEVWLLDGNVGADPTNHFIGTADNQPLEIRANGRRALRIEWTGDSAHDVGTEDDGSVNLLGGAPTNSIASGVVGSFIGGGGASKLTYDSTGGPYSISAPNRVWGDYDVIAGGVRNTTSNAFSTVSGGIFNTAAGVAATVAGGSYNTAAGSASAIGGGDNNDIESSTDSSTIAGGWANRISRGATGSTIGGGRQNSVRTNAMDSTIGGGAGNRIEGFLGGGRLTGATIGGGVSNTIQPGADYATIPGGFDNVAAGDFSFAAGSQAEALHDETFVWAGGATRPYATTLTSSFNAYAAGGHSFDYGAQSDANPRGARWVYFGPANAGNTIATWNGARLTDGGVWSNASDRNRKTDFKTVNAREILEQVAALPVNGWRYTNETARVKHLGPTAQDFHAAFGLGTDDKTIGTVDADGVALAAIQGLNQKVEETRAENAELKARLERLESLLNQNARSKD